LLPLRIVLQKATHFMHEITKNNIKDLIQKAKAMAFRGTRHMRSRIVIGGSMMEQVNSFMKPI
jgi:hypothetical protein